MRITKLELHGFKSFPDRTMFHFGRGISCVVGPNGCGKSNVVDALKWCIGEQSARSLRGSEMSDVIFAGSSDRKPVGFAEVQLTLAADHSEPFPGPYAQMNEVQVGRRLHRTGTSEYLINKVRTRRRDVVDLFLDTGVGNDLYSFIEQGQVDKMVAASAAERRTLIDEAAGIARYKSKRSEALSRLGSTAQQLDRVADVLDEQSRRLKSLERQAFKAAQFRRLRARIRQRELYLALVKFTELAADRRALRQSLRAGQTSDAGIRHQIARRESDLEERREESALIDAAVQTWRDRVAELDARARELNSVQQLSAQRRDELSDQAQRVETEQTEASDALAVARSEAAQATEAAAQARLSASDNDDLVHAATEAVEAEGVLLAEALAEEQRADTAVETQVAARLGLEARLAGVASDLDELAAEAHPEAQVQRAAQGVEAALIALRRHEDEAEQVARIAAVRASDAALSARWVQLGRSIEEQVDGELEQLKAVHQAGVAARARALAETRDRGQRWLDALEAAARRGATADDAKAQAELHQGQQRGRSRLQEVRDQGAAALDQAVVAARERAAAEVDSAQRTASAAVAERAHVQARLEEARASAEANRLARVQVRAERDALRRSAFAADAVDERLQELGEVTLAVVDGLEPEERPDAVRRLGERALLPWVTSPDLLRDVVERLGPGERGAIAVWPEPMAVVAGVRHVTLHEALAAESGAEYVGDRFRLRADGVLEVGEDAASAVLADRQRHAALHTRLDELLAATEADEGSVRELAEALAASRDRVATAEAAVDTTRAATTRQIEAARLAQERALEQRVAAEQVTVDQEQVSLREGLQARGRELRGRWEARRTRARAAFTGAVAAQEQIPEAGAGPNDTKLRAVRTRRQQLDEVHGKWLRDDAAAQAEVRAGAARTDAARAAHRVATTRHAEAVERLERRRRRVEVAEQAHVELSEAMSVATRDEAEVRAQRDRCRAAREGVVARAREAGEVRSAVAARQASAKARADDADAAASRALRHADQEGARLERLASQQEALRTSIGEAESARVDAEGEIEGSTNQRSEAWDRLQQERQRAERAREGLATAEKALRELVVRREEVGSEVQRTTEAAQAAQSGIDVLRQRMTERYQVSLPALLDRLSSRGRLELEVDPEVQSGLDIAGKQVEGVSVSTLRESDLADEDRVVAAVTEVEADRRALASLGEVHLGALEEVRELYGRHEELGAQRSDLEESIRSIRAAIAKMNRTCREKFREAFDRVNEEFQASYPELLGGGSARLALTDEEDLLETGVDIFVQPPGKRLQHLTLLSGGEKAMCAIALLIALFRVKPSPFCVLDEVDAPLDEANGARFNDMLRLMSRTSQFVVITHNRKTMECADTLYGVTMARPGVSRLVSVHL